MPTRAERYSFTCEGCGEYDPDDMHRTADDVPLCTKCAKELMESEMTVELENQGGRSYVVLDKEKARRLLLLIRSMQAVREAAERYAEWEFNYLAYDGHIPKSLSEDRDALRTALQDYRRESAGK